MQIEYQFRWHGTATTEANSDRTLAFSVLRVELMISNDVGDLVWELENVTKLGAWRHMFTKYQKSYHRRTIEK